MGTESAPEIPRLRTDYASDFTRSFTLDPFKTALIIIDMQYATASWQAGLGRRFSAQPNIGIVEWRLDRVDEIVIPTLHQLLTYFRCHALKIIYITSGSELGDFTDVAWHFQELARATNNRAGAREHEIRDEIKPVPGELVLTKTGISAFNTSNLDSVLRAMGIEYLLFAGVSTNVCVDTTARDGSDRGFRCVLIDDCCSATKPEYHAAALVSFQRFFGRVAGAEEIMRELDQAKERRRS